MPWCGLSLQTPVVELGCIYEAILRQPDPAWELAGLGGLAVLSDELLLGVLGLLPAQSLVMASLASKSLYCFCNYEDLWRVLVLEVSTAAIHASMCAVYAKVGYVRGAQSQLRPFPKC